MPVFDVSGEFIAVNVNSNIGIKASNVGSGIRSWVFLSTLYPLSSGEAGVVVNFCEDASDRDSKFEVRILFQSLY